MAKDKYEDYDGTPASNTDVGGINIQGSASIANGDNALREIMSHTADHFAGDTIASASTTDLGSKSAHYLEVTGTTTITAFGTIKAGTVKFLRFSGALTLTHNATSLILTTGANVITVAGDMAIAVSEGSGNWRVTFIRGTAALARGVDLATAATLNLDSVDAPSVDLTGTTTVTAVTLTSRRWRICRADGAFLLTAGASLIINGSTSVNYTTVAGDLLLFQGYGSGVVRVWVLNTLIASQAEMEAGSSTAVAVSPGRQHFHPSAAKFWILYNGSTNAINASYNTDSPLTDNGAGDQTVGITTDFSGASYAFALSSSQFHTVVAAQAAGSIRIQTFNSANAAADATIVSAVGFGDQA
jgi:hypothetical protein